MKVDEVVFLSLLLLMVGMCTIPAAIDQRREAVAKHQALYGWSDLRREIAETRAAVLNNRAGRIRATRAYEEEVRFRKEHREFYGLDLYGPPTFGFHDYLAREKILRAKYEGLLREFNRRQNVNYSLIGGDPLAATLHLCNDLPQDVPSGLPHPDMI